MTVHCGALTDTLLTSELFGHAKGAFTGAIKDKIGRFQMADGGTLVLDEIGEVPLHLQKTLLRVIEYKEFERVGDSRPVKVDVRIVSSTNRNLKEEVTKGNFREDHGNAEKMQVDDTGQAHTAHTTNLVPLVYVGRPAEFTGHGALCDIAPTLLSLMGLPKPNEMSGTSLVELHSTTAASA